MCISHFWGSSHLVCAWVISYKTLFATHRFVIDKKCEKKLLPLMWTTLSGSALRSAAHGDIVVPSHRTDWGLRSSAVAGPSSWNALPAGLRSYYYSPLELLR